jgi:hypothetical protein
VKAHVIGVVLNDVDIQKSTYGSYQYYKYGYAAYAPGKTSHEEPLPEEEPLPPPGPEPTVN